MQRSFASLLLLLATSPLWGQINLAPEHRLGQRIVATSAAEAKAYSWHCDTADLLTDGSTCFVWAREGKHTLTLVTVDEDYTIRRYEQSFDVSDSPSPPTPATLRDLVTSDEAAQIAGYLRALADQVGGINGPTHFWSVWQQTFPVQGNAKLDAALKARLDPAIEKKAGLSVELKSIADEFEKEAPPKPTPPPVTEGKRKILIAHESGDKASWFGQLTAELRKPGSNADSYLKANGHSLAILDDELIRESKGWNAIVGNKLDQLPRLFIIDPTTNAILFEQVIANGTTADNITERIRESGG